MKLWKVQKFFGDIVYDLRNRGLLPVVVLLLVGIVAVPVVISRGGGGSNEPAATSSAAVKPASEIAPEGQQAVLAYNPGLRDYKKRLNQLQAKDPFKQQFVETVSAAAELSTTLESTGGGTETATSVGSTGGSTGSGSAGSTGSTGAASPDSGDSGGSAGKTRVRYFSYQTDLSIGEANLQPQSRKRVAPFTYLPDQALPVLVFLGPSADGKAAIFLVSQSVSSVFGSGACFPAADQCQLLALSQGQTQDLVYDVDGKTYRIKVDRIRRVVTSKPPRG
jgi:hypothetical protein